MRLLPFFAGALVFVVSAPSLAGEKVSFPGEALFGDEPQVTVEAVVEPPDGAGPHPAVVLLPDCTGPKAEHFTRLWPKFLNRLGYLTVNVDSFSPRGGKKCAPGFNLSPKAMIQDAYGALAYLAGRADADPARVGVMGASKAALAIHLLAGMGKTTSAGLSFGAGASLYPSSCEKVKAGAKMVPLVIVVGDQEKEVQTCRDLGKAKKLSVNILPGVYHSFDDETAKGNKLGALQQTANGSYKKYDRGAIRKAEQLIEAFFATHLAPGRKANGGPGPQRGARQGGGAGKDPEKAVARVDSDGDGRVSLAEWDKPEAVFRKIDADGDGFLTAEEFEALWSRAQQ